MIEGPLTEDPELDALVRAVSRAPRAACAPPPSRVGPYEIGARLGAGGMGVVYRARDTRLDRDVALKLLPSRVSGDPARRALLVREARAAAAVVHPNVTAVFDVGDADGVSYLAMELAIGRTLRAELRRGPVATGRVLAYARAIAAGLAAAHAAGVIHRDLTPENVIVGEGGSVKILDFGLAKAAPAPALETGDGVTLAGCGTRRYMAPEQARGERVDARADVYAFGVVVYEMLTGVTPDAAPSGALARAPAALRALVAACLAPAAASRPASGAALVAALAALERGARRRRRATAATAIALVAAAAVAVVGGAQAKLARGARTDDRAAALQPRRATNNSVEAPVLAAAISPDGARIAYSERRGVFVATLHDETIATTQLAPAPADAIAWMPDGRAVVVTTRDGEVAAIAPGGARRTLVARGATPRVLAAAPSHDAERLLLVRDGGLAIAPIDRPEEARVLLARPGALFGATWSPDDRLVGFATIDAEATRPWTAEIDVVDAERGQRAVVHRSERLLQEVGEVAFAFTGPNAIAAALARTDTDDAALVAIDVDPRTLGARGLPRTIARLDGGAVSHLSATRDAGRLGFVRYRSQTDVLVGDLGDDARSLGPLRRVTLSDANERPSDFADDGRLLVVADAARRQATLRVDPGTGLGEPLVPGAAWTTWAAALPSRGALAFRLDEGADRRARVSLARVDGDGTTATAPLDLTVAVLGRGRPEPRSVAMRCAARTCVLATADDRGVRLDEIDPRTLSRSARGRAEHASLASGFALSPDGASVAMAEADMSGYAVFDLEGRRRATLRTPGCFAQFAAFAPSGRALVTTTMCSSDAVYEVRRLDLDGTAATLAATPHAWLAHPVVSRDGRRLALASMPFESNVFVVDVRGQKE